MSITESELAAVLAHCRELQAAAEAVVSTTNARQDAVANALRAWRGPTRPGALHTYRTEESDASACAVLLRAEADAWARAWADAVNAHNAEQQARLQAEAATGVLQRTPLPVAPVVTPPTAQNGYAATGGLIR